MTYRFRFRDDVRIPTASHYNLGPILTLDSANLAVRQFYSVDRVTGDRRTGPATSLGTNFQIPPWNVGPKSTPDYASLANAAIFNLPGNGGKVFAGPRDDPFFVNIGAIGDLATLRPVQQLHLVPPVAQSAPGVDGLRGYNVQIIAIQIPISQLVAGGVPPLPRPQRTP